MRYFLHSGVFSRETEGIRLIGMDDTWAEIKLLREQKHYFSCLMNIFALIDLLSQNGSYNSTDKDKEAHKKESDCARIKEFIELMIKEVDKHKDQTKSKYDESDIKNIFENDYPYQLYRLRNYLFHSLIISTELRYLKEVNSEEHREFVFFDDDEKVSIITPTCYLINKKDLVDILYYYIDEYKKLCEHSDKGVKKLQYRRELVFNRHALSNGAYYEGENYADEYYERYAEKENYKLDKIIIYQYKDKFDTIEFSIDSIDDTKKCLKVRKVESTARYTNDNIRHLYNESHENWMLIKHILDDIYPWRGGLLYEVISLYEKEHKEKEYKEKIVTWNIEDFIYMDKYKNSKSDKILARDYINTEKWNVKIDEENKKIIIELKE